MYPYIKDNGICYSAHNTTCTGYNVPTYNANATKGYYPGINLNINNV